MKMSFENDNEGDRDRKSRKYSDREKMTGTNGSDPGRCGGGSLVNED